jgi:hypothetical protein
MKSEYLLLQKLIYDLLGVDIKSKSRSQDHSDARKIFSHIMHSRGCSKSNIAKAMGLNHTSILYYIPIVENLLENDINFSCKYQLCYDKFLEDRIKSLDLQKDRLIKLKSGDEDLVPIINFLRKNIKKGTEDQVRSVIKKAVSDFYANDLRHN